MLKKHVLLSAVALILILGGCAKRSTAWENEPVLTLVKQVPVVGNPADLCYDDDNIFVALDQGGLSIIDANTYSSRWWTQLYPVSSDALLVNIRNVSVVGEHKLLFLGEYVGADKIRIVDYSDPDTLKLIDSITGGTDGLQEINFSAIDNPTGDNIIKGFFGAGRNLNFANYNGVLYLGTDYVINTPATAAGMDYNDSYIFVAVQQRGLAIYNRATQQLLSETVVPGEALKVKVSGNYAYIAGRQGGLSVVNIADPANPVLVSNFDTTGYATSIDIKGSLAVVSSGGGGIYLFDISNPENPVLKQNLISAGYTNNAKFHNDRLVVASRDQGILIYDID
ncbi:MAG: hypothetical protein K0B87_08265 [Candidatus Syntrophosphaera sp.]|nr:hypothetical protein [Candidatus Syntrophosphaera sp.]